MSIQSIEAQVRKLWQRLESWAAVHAPQILRYLNAPATEDDIFTLEQALGLQLPLAFRACLKIHNGEDDPWGPSILDNGAYMLPIQRIFEVWHHGVQYAQSKGRLSLEDPRAWAAWILAGSINVHGPVKPMHVNLRWVPITNCNGDIIRYLDFDPPLGGTPGQLIEVDVEGGTWRVLAPSFFDFFKQYVEGIEKGKYLIDEYDAVRSTMSDHDFGFKQLPEYLQDVTFQCPGIYPVSSQADIETLQPGQTAILEGMMRYLQGNGSETLFTLASTWGREYSIFSSSWRTEGFLQIRVHQQARVVVTRYNDSIVTKLSPPSRLKPIELLAVNYTMLQSSESSSGQNESIL